MPSIVVDIDISKDATISDSKDIDQEEEKEVSRKHTCNLLCD